MYLLTVYGDKQCTCVLWSGCILIVAEQTRECCNVCSSFLFFKLAGI